MDMKLEIAESLSAACGVAAEEIAAAIEVPANTDMGTLRTLASNWQRYCVKRLLSSPRKSVKTGKPDFIADVKIVGAYINFFMDKHFYTKRYWKLS